MSVKAMARGRSQVLFFFLPGRTFDYEGGQSICRVSEFEFDENTELTKPWVLRAVNKLLQGWREPDGADRLLRFPDPLRYPDEYVLAEPKKVLVDVFPLTFQCRNCRRVTFFYSIDQASRHSLTCFCGGTMHQVHHVQVHNCGHIMPLMPPACPIHKRAHIALDDRGSQVYKNFRWVCLACNRELPEPLSVECPECAGNPQVKREDRRMRPAVHRASTTYYNHSVTLVNLPSNQLTNLLQDQDYRHLITGAYLGLTNLDDLKTLAVGSGGENQVEILFNQLQQMLHQVPEAMRPAIEKQLAELRPVFAESGSSARTRLINQVKGLVADGDDEEAMTDLAKELVEYLRPGAQLHTRTLADLKNYAVRHGLGDRLSDYGQYTVEWERLGLSDVKVVEDFPITTAIVGYTRVLRDPKREVGPNQTELSWLRSFPLDSKNRVPMYVASQEAEAILVNINPLEVLKWLELNGLAQDLPPVRDEQSVRAWFLRHMASIDPYQDEKDTDPITSHVTGLIHTMSHILLRQAVNFCGFDPTSLSEYLFPRALSFVMYANTLQGFSIGGLHTLFEQSLHKWLREAYDMGAMCVYDPVCSEDKSACHACSHVSEVSCTHFNRWLGRRLLYGGRTPEGDTLIGFWDPRCRIGGGTP